MSIACKEKSHTKLQVSVNWLSKNDKSSKNDQMTRTIEFFFPLILLLHILHLKHFLRNTSFHPFSFQNMNKKSNFFYFSGLDERGLEAQQMSSGLYGHRSNSSASSSPPATSGSGQTGLVVPQPINAAKGPGQSGNSAAGHHSGNNNSGHITHPSNGSTGRKYQCKMCPQVGKVIWLLKLLIG